MKKNLLLVLICFVLCAITITPTNAATKKSEFKISSSTVTVKKGKSQKVYASFYYEPFKSNIESPALYSAIKASSKNTSIATIKKSTVNQVLDFFLPYVGTKPAYNYYAAYNITGKKVGSTQVNLKLTYGSKTYSKIIKVTVKK